MHLSLLVVFVLLTRASAKQVHVVFGNHLDIGFNNIPYVGYDNNVLNVYFNQYLPLAVDISDYMSRVSPNKDRYIYTTHSYVISLFLECPTNMGLECPSDTTKAKVLRGIQTGAITWHAHPHNAQYEFYDPSLLDFSFALTHTLDKRFGFKPKQTAKLRDVPGLTRAAIPIFVRNGIRAVSVGVNGGSAPPGVPPYTPFLWRDEASNTQILAFWHPGGYGGYRDGGLCLDPPDQCIQAPGLDHVLCTAWRNDNDGPPETVVEPLKVYQLLKQEWTTGPTNDTQSSSSSSSPASSPKSPSTGSTPPVSSSNVSIASSNVFASSFDAFVDAVLEAVSSQGLQLPVITAEIGDTWIFGVQSDPAKTANFRAISRARAACITDPNCVSESPSFYEFSRMLVKVPEHTWGVDVKKTLHDFTNYSNADFHQCITPTIKELGSFDHKQQQQQHRQTLVGTSSEYIDLPECTNFSINAGSSCSDDGVPLREFPCLNYQNCVHAWDRQAAYINWAIKSLPSDHPVVQGYSADVAARQQLKNISHEQLAAAGAITHHTAAAAAVPSSSSSSSSAAAAAAGYPVRGYQHVLEAETQPQTANQQQQQQQHRATTRSPQQQYTCGSWQFTLDEAQGGLTSLRKMYGQDTTHPGVDWAQGTTPNNNGSSASQSPNRASAATADPRLQDGCKLSTTGAAAAAGGGGVLGQLRYSAYCESSYDFVWKYYEYQQPMPWWFPLDFGKVNSSDAWNKEVHVNAEPLQVYEIFSPSGALQQLTWLSTFPAELVTQVGAPPVMWTTITCPQNATTSHSRRSPTANTSTTTGSNRDIKVADDNSDLEVSVVWKRKTPTRLPEALWFSFVPAVGAIDGDSWRMNKLGSKINPQEVMVNGSQSMHAVLEGGIEVTSADKSELLQIKTLDTALVSPGHPNPFPNGAFAPCMQEGMHFNLMNNIWGTNYIMWVPYGEDDVDMGFRFSIHAEKTQQQ